MTSPHGCRAWRSKVEPLNHSSFYNPYLDFDSANLLQYGSSTLTDAWFSRTPGFVGPAHLICLSSLLNQLCSANIPGSKSPFSFGAWTDDVGSLSSRPDKEEETSLSSAQCDRMSHIVSSTKLSSAVPSSWDNRRLCGHFLGFHRTVKLLISNCLKQILLQQKTFL